MKGMADSYIGTTGTAADTVSGATYSANAINEAVAKAMVKSQANEAEADTADTPSGDNGQNDNQNGSDNTMIHKSLLMIKPIPAIQETTVMNVC